MTDQEDLQKTIAQLNDSLTSFEWDEQALEETETVLMDVLCFMNHGHQYALPSEDVQEVLGHVELTHLPGAPNYIDGVMIHRRNVIGVLNINVWLYPNEQWEKEANERIILVEHGPYAVGIHAGQEVHIEQWPQSSTSHAGLNVLSSDLRAYCLGVQENDYHQATLLLNIRKILEDAAIKG